ncbi:MAG: gamma-butyrobetaine hydroxylase-like domain-containing protein [Pseudomonadota bacterium]
MSKLFPTQINLHKKSRLLEIEFNNDKKFNLSCEFLRTQSKSAEVKSSNVPVSGKINVNIEKIEPQGDYGIRLYFDDGYDTGIFSWGSLYDLGQNYNKVWNLYLEKIQQYGLQRGQSDKNNSGKIKILYFMDKLIKTIKREEEDLELTENIKTVDDLLVSIRNRGRIWNREFAEGNMLFTVNKEFSELFTVLEDGDEIAFIPKAK